MNATRRRNFFLILMLGALNTVSPFSIDMYLPAFPEMAEEFGTTPAKISLSVSSYFIGLAIGQIFYGPLLDRFGRKPPLYAGLSIYILACIGCMLSQSVDSLVAFRFVQAIGGCVAGIAAMSMVRDFFPAKDSAKIFSLMMLILGASPLFAPTVGSIVAVHLGWQAVFVFLAGIVSAILAMVYFLLPEGHTADPTISLKPRDMAHNFLTILKVPQFTVYALAGSFGFAGILAYVAGAPIIFMDIYKLSATTFGLLFAGLSIGFIGGNQINILLLKKYTSEQIFHTAMIAQSIICVIFFAGTWAGIYNMYATLALLFAYICALSLILPNTAALALMPFTRNIGSASALMGSMQIGVAAVVSSAIGFLSANSMTPIIGIMAASTWIGLCVMIWGQRHITGPVISADDL